jgi:insertion element IS1 protein InsB
VYPGCGAVQFKRNGRIHTGKQNHQCKDCGRPFVLYAEKRVIAEEQRILVARLLREKISLHGICRAVGVGIKWLMHVMMDRFKAAPDHLHIQLPRSPSDVIVQQLCAEADEMCSVVGKKANQQGLWMAIDTQTRQIMAFHVGDHSRKSAEQLWAKIPVAYREQETFYTDRYEAYTGVVPAAQHKAITKLAVKPIISNASTTRYASEFPASCVTPEPSRRSSPIILELSSSSYANITSQGLQHYLDNTTKWRGMLLVRS